MNTASLLARTAEAVPATGLPTLAPAPVQLRRRERWRRMLRHPHLNILSVSTSDAGGGAERIGVNLFNAFGQRGHGSWLAVGHVRSGREQQNVLKIPNDTERGIWGDVCFKLHDSLETKRGRIPAAGRIRRVLRNVASLGKTIPARLGHEEMYFPASRRLLEVAPEQPDIIFCHNLHGSYFDLRSLSRLSQHVPVVLLLHDMWTMTGHCAYTLGCDRWKIGCGSCPDLNIYPAIERDATASNWRRKQKLYGASQLYVSTPSQWLMSNVNQSMLAHGIVGSRVIPYGVDHTVFHPGDKAANRAELGLPQDAHVLLFVANGVRTNIFKDYATLRASMEAVVRDSNGERIVFVALGSDEDTEVIGNVEIRHVPFKQDSTMVAQYYRAADLYLHAANDDNFPCTILEALSCGVPVVATAVGGISEEIRGLRGVYGGDPDFNRYEADSATGVLVAHRDSEGIAAAVADLLSNKARLKRLSENAVSDAQQRFDMDAYVDALLDWFREILDSRARGGQI